MLSSFSRTIASAAIGAYGAIRECVVQMPRIGETVSARQPSQRLRSEVVDVKPVQIIKKLSTFIRGVMDCVWDFNIEQPVRRQKQTQCAQQAEIQKVFQDVRKNDEIERSLFRKYRAKDLIGNFSNHAQEILSANRRGRAGIKPPKYGLRIVRSKF